MTAMNTFPPLRLAVLSGLIALKNNMGDLDLPDCPYDEEQKGILRELLAPTIVEKVVEKEIRVEAKAGKGRPSKDVRLSEDDQETLKTEIHDLISSLTEMGTGEGLATNERIQITKTKTNLVDQLLKMRERNTTAAKLEAFQETVIGILNDLVGEADREQFLDRLEPYR